MDVAKPGESPADATARPIITGHAIMKDPMVNDEPGSKPASTEEEIPAEAEKKEPIAPSAAHKVIKPLDAPDTKTTKAEGELTAASEKLADTKPESEDTEEESAPSDDAVVDAVLEQVGDKKEETKQSEEERKRQELVDRLVQEKKYFLPINQARARRNNRRVLIVLAALLPVVVGLGLAARMGMLKLPDNFLKAKPTQSATSQSTQVAPIPTTPKAVMSGLPDADTVKWTKITSSQKGFSVKAPDGWQMANFKSLDSLFSTGVTYMAGTPATVQSVDTYPGQMPARVEVFQYKNNQNQLTFGADYTKTDFSSGTLKGTQYYRKVPVQPIKDGGGVYAGMEEYTYVFTTKASTTYVRYILLNYNQYAKAALPNLTQSDTNQLPLVEKLVKTLQIAQ